jgi:CRP-like cAMP-binding protein
MIAKQKTTAQDTNLFLEELQKRVSIPEGDFEKFLELWEFKKFARNEFIMPAGEIPKFSIFVLKGCLRQYATSEEGDETIVYFAEERHWIGDLPAMRNKEISNFNFQAIEKCELLTISAENWKQAFIRFPWWTEAHVTGYQKWATKMQQQMADMHTQTAKEKYLKLVKEKPALLQRVPQHYIASYLGLSAETLSRIRKKISKQ